MAETSSALPHRILVVRRDNIGDLVCTTPLLQALRAHFPAARIEALVNSYNAPVLAGHPSVDAVHVYTKLKHRVAGEGRWAVLGRRLRLWWWLRQQCFDYVIVAGRGGVERTVGQMRRLRPRHIVAFANADGRAPKGVDLSVIGNAHGLHEVEDTFRLLQPLGIDAPAPAVSIAPPTDEGAITLLTSRGWQAGQPRIGVHISARKPSNRWPHERYVELIRKIHAHGAAHFLLFWSPGASDDPRHPGDDAKAQAILDALSDVPITAYPTQRLEQLIGGLAVCDRVICSDGGAMHVAAGLGKPILCFFGDSDASRWRPWGVPQVLLQPASRNVADITVVEAEAGYQHLHQQASMTPHAD